MVLRQCDVLIAIWNGEEPAGQGGTGQIVEEAIRLEIPTVWIHSRAPHDICLLVQDEDGQRCELAPDEFPRCLRQLLVLSSPLQPDIRETYFSEAQPSWILLGLLFKAFRNLVAEGRLGSLQIHVRDFSPRRGFLQCKQSNLSTGNEDGAWIGYFQDYPDYWTQGETLDDLKDHLPDLYHDLTSEDLPGIRKVDELVVA